MSHATPPIRASWMSRPKIEPRPPRPPRRPGRLKKPPNRPPLAAAGAPAVDLPGCVMVRWVGAAALGAVVVEGGAVKVREPRLPELNPPPARALASAITRTSAAATATNASNGRMRRKLSIEFLPDQPERGMQYIGMDCYFVKASHTGIPSRHSTVARIERSEIRDRAICAPNVAAK